LKGKILRESKGLAGKKTFSGQTKPYSVLKKKKKGEEI